MDLVFKETTIKSINILVNCRNFAIEMDETINMDVVMAVGNFLARDKDKDGSRFIWGKFYTGIGIGFNKVLIK